MGQEIGNELDEQNGKNKSECHCVSTPSVLILRHGGSAVSSQRWLSVPVVVCGQFTLQLSNTMERNVTKTFRVLSDCFNEFLFL